MARLAVDLDLAQVRVIVRDLDSTLDPVGFARLHGGVSDVYRIDLAGTESPLVLKRAPRKIASGKSSTNLTR